MYLWQRRYYGSDPNWVGHLTGALDVQAAFERYQFEGWPILLGSYYPEIVQEFYALYVTLVYLVTPVEGRGVNKPSLARTLVRGVRVDVSEEMIRQFLFGLIFVGSTTTTNFDYRLRIVRSRWTMWDDKQRAHRVSFDRWGADQIIE